MDDDSWDNMHSEIVQGFGYDDDDDDGMMDVPALPALEVHFLREGQDDDGEEVNACLQRKTQRKRHQNSFRVPRNRRGSLVRYLHDPKAPVAAAQSSSSSSTSRGISKNNNEKSLLLGTRVSLSGRRKGHVMARGQRRQYAEMDSHDRMMMASSSSSSINNQTHEHVQKRIQAVAAAKAKMPLMQKFHAKRAVARAAILAMLNHARKIIASTSPVTWKASAASCSSNMTMFVVKEPLKMIKCILLAWEEFTLPDHKNRTKMHRYRDDIMRIAVETFHGVGKLKTQEVCSIFVCRFIHRCVTKN